MPKCSYDGHYISNENENNSCEWARLRSIFVLKRKAATESRRPSTIPTPDSMDKWRYISRRPGEVLPHGLHKGERQLGAEKESCEKTHGICKTVIKLCDVLCGDLLFRENLELSEDIDLLGSAARERKNPFSEKREVTVAQFAL